ncbi:Fad-binding protein, partial [Thalictrum thalictroides]
MASIENVVLPDLDKRVYCIFSDFMTKITKFEEMVSIASKLLVGFHQQLEVNTCQQGLEDHLSKAKGELNELQMLMDELVCVVQTANTSTSQCQDEQFSDVVLHAKEEIEYTPLIKPEVSDYTVMMAIEKIVTSLSLNSSPGELETYHLMWSVRPFVNDDTMHQAWRFIS